MQSRRNVQDWEWRTGRSFSPAARPSQRRWWTRNLSSSRPQPKRASPPGSSSMDARVSRPASGSTSQSSRICLPELLRTAGSRMSTPHTYPRYMDRGTHILKRPAQEGISAVQQRSVMSLHARRGRSFRVMVEFPKAPRAQRRQVAESPTSRTQKGCLYMIPGLPAMSRVRSSSRMAKM